MLINTQIFRQLFNFYFFNIFRKFKYFTKKVVFLIKNKTILPFEASYIDSKLRKAIFTINTLKFLLTTNSANLFLLMILAYRIIGKALAIV